MMKIRKHEGVWEIRELVMNSFKWHTCKNLEDLQESIVSTAVHLDHYTKMALEIIQGTSEIYIYENGELTRREPLGKVFCLTPFLQQRCTLITLIKFIESGIWRPRTLFAAGARLSYILSVVLLSLPFLYFLIVDVEYRWNRIIAFLYPWRDPLRTGYQIIQSFLALGTGGLFGQGLGQGKQKLFYLPEAHTDFILAVVGEKLGFVGILVIVGLFFLLILRSLRVAAEAKDTFGRFLALGIAVLLGIESSFNMAVVTGMMPTKGLALPFVSYGGSSLVVTLFAVGILLNISSKKTNN